MEKSGDGRTSVWCKAITPARAAGIGARHAHVCRGDIRSSFVCGRRLRCLRVSLRRWRSSRSLQQQHRYRTDLHATNLSGGSALGRTGDAASIASARNVELRSAASPQSTDGPIRVATGLPISAIAIDGADDGVCRQVGQGFGTSGAAGGGATGADAAGTAGAACAGAAGAAAAG